MRLCYKVTPLVAYVVVWQQFWNRLVKVPVGVILVDVSCQFLGVITQRRLFFAQEPHPQEMCYRRMS